MDYGFVHEGRVFTPNRSVVDAAENDRRNAAIEKAELDAWKAQPDCFAAYVSDDRLVKTWLGTVLGRIVSRSTHRNNLGAKIECVTVRGNNGATYHGRYGCDWASLVRLRKSKS